MPLERFSAGRSLSVKDLLAFIGQLHNEGRLDLEVPAEVCVNPKAIPLPALVFGVDWVAVDTDRKALVLSVGNDLLSQAAIVG